LILRKLGDLGEEAYGYRAIESLSNEMGTWLDPSQCYNAIKGLAGKGYLQEPILRPSPSGGPPMKVYRLSASGRAALKSTAAHHRALADYLDGVTGSKTSENEIAAEAPRVDAERVRTRRVAR